MAAAQDERRAKLIADGLAEAERSARRSPTREADRALLKDARGRARIVTQTRRAARRNRGSKAQAKAEGGASSPPPRHWIDQEVQSARRLLRRQVTPSPWSARRRSCAARSTPAPTRRCSTS
jgi:hypothetical protein